MAANTCNQPPQFEDGTGGQANYTIDFEYINRADVEVYVGSPGNWTQFTEGNAANANEYQWQNDSTIRLNATSGSDNVLITRETDRCDPAVEFFAGTSIRAEDLNANQEQTLFLIQELAQTMGENGMDQPPGSDGITLDDLEDVEITTPANPSWLRWNGTQWEDQPILETGDTWVADDNHVVTAARGDARWLQGGAAGDVIGGPGIEIDTGTVGQVTVSADLTANGGLEFSGSGNAQEIRVDDGNGIVVDSTGVNVGAGNGITVNANDVAINLNTTNPGLAVDANGLRTDGNQTNIGTVQFGTGDVYTFPTSDGTANQVLVTDGSGSLSWATNTADNTTYDLTATDNGDDADINLVDSNGTTDTVTIAAGTNVTVDHSGSTITINSTGGTDTNTTYDLTVPSGTTDIRLAGSDSTNDDITITGGTNVTVTRTSATELTIAASGSALTIEDEGTALTTAATTLNFTGSGVTASGTGAEKTINIPGGTSGITVQDEGTSLATAATTLNFTGAGVTASGTGAAKTINVPGTTGGVTFRGTVDVDDDNTLPATTGQQNPNAVAVGDAFTVENDVLAASVTTNWDTVLDSWTTSDPGINSGDIIICTTAAAAGSPTDARYNLIRTGGANTLQTVTTAGNTTTHEIVVDGLNIGGGPGTGSNNTRVGPSALNANTTGGQNTAVGSAALVTNETGSNNTAIGRNSLFSSTGSNNVALGTSTLGNVTSDNNIGIGHSAGSSITTGGSNTIIGNLPGTSNMSFTMLFGAGATERFRVDNNGRFLFGTQAARVSQFFNGANIQSDFQIESNTSSRRCQSQVHNSDDSSQPFFILGKTRGTSVGDLDVVQNDDHLGTLSFQGADGSQLVEAARIQVRADGTPGANDMPGRFEFWTTADGASSSTERMRIDSSGDVEIGGTLGTSPNISLNAAGGAEFSGDVVIGAAASQMTDAALTLANPNSVALGLARSGTGGGGQFDGAIELNTNGDFAFRNGSNSTTVAGLTERMRITAANGDVQIGGTLGTSPNISLNADGGARFANDNIQLQSDSQIVVVNGTGNDANTAIAIRNAADDATNIELRYNGSAAFASNININSSQILLKSDGNADFAGRITSGSINTSASDVAGAQIFPQGILNLQRPSTDNQNAEFARFWYGNTASFRFECDGRLILGGTDNGIQFGTTNSGGNITSQTLSDYEEGTWTPSLGGNTTYTTQVGHYTKIGNQVTVWCRLVVNTRGTGTNFKIEDLPFTPSNTVDNAGSITDFANLNVSVVSIYPRLVGNTTDITFSGLTSAGSATTQNMAVWQDNAGMTVSVTYQTDS